MFLSHRALSLFTVSLLTGAAVWALAAGSDGGGQQQAGPVSRALKYTQAQADAHPAKEAGAASRPEEAALPLLSVEEFASLKKRLMACDESCTGGITQEYRALVEEVVDRAPFSAGMKELMVMNLSGELRYTGKILSEVMPPRLLNPLSSGLRRRLVEAYADPAEGFRRIAHEDRLASLWHHYAGEASTTPEYDALREIATDTEFRKGLETGHLLGQARVAPVEAVATVLALQREEAPGDDWARTLLYIIVDRLAPEADFPGIAAQLPPSSGESGEAEAGILTRARLAARWGQVDPASSAAWVQESGDSLPPQALFQVVRGFDEKDPAPAQAWARAFPPGPYRDAAAVAVAFRYQAALEEKGLGGDFAREPEKVLTAAER